MFVILKKTNSPGGIVSMEVLFPFKLWFHCVNVVYILLKSLCSDVNEFTDIELSFCHLGNFPQPCEYDNHSVKYCKI